MGKSILQNEKKLAIDLHSSNKKETAQDIENVGMLLVCCSYRIESKPYPFPPRRVP